MLLLRKQDRVRLISRGGYDLTRPADRRVWTVTSEIFL
jgi:hypothetical protein